MRRWFFLLVLLSGCIPQPPPKTVTIMLVYLPFHVDRRIVGERRAWLEEARVTLEEDTHGVLQIFFDFDFDSTEPMRKTDGWRIVDLPEAAPKTTHFDELHTTHVLGECDSGEHIVYLIHERLESKERFIHVAMHEILHSVGVQHVKDPHAIMAPFVLSKLPLHMSETDLDAFCQTIKCATREVRP